MDLDALVLVGGRSRRLGRDKALVELGNMTLAARAVSTLREALSPRSISLVAANKDQYPPGTLDGSLPMVSDVYPGKGANGAVHAALAGAVSEWAAVLACDLPFVTPELMRRLAALLATDIDAVIPVQPDGRFQPLCALYRVNECLGYLDGILNLYDDIPALAEITASLRTRLITFDELSALPDSQHFFFNINTPEDLRKAQQLWVSAV